jgi:hypothetical protein
MCWTCRVRIKLRLRAFARGRRGAPRRLSCILPGTKTRVGLSLIALVCAGCASSTAYTVADDRAVDPVRQKYQACLKEQTEAVVDGSNDVPFLVHYIVAQCDSQLVPAGRYLRDRGFTPGYVDHYLADVRQEAGTVTSGVILRMKSAQVQGRH